MQIGNPRIIVADRIRQHELGFRFQRQRESVGFELRAEAFPGYGADAAFASCDPCSQVVHSFSLRGDPYRYRISRGSTQDNV
jgi:hypothetical protein